MPAWEKSGRSFVVTKGWNYLFRMLPGVGELSHDNDDQRAWYGPDDARKIKPSPTSPFHGHSSLPQKTRQTQRE